MRNIPTDLLRTLVTVNDRRSFTKAAQALGITQPGVSTQIKRLQILLGCEVFERSPDGIRATPQGEVVISYARRLLSLNDQILDVGGRAQQRPELIIQVGTANDFIAERLPNALARFRERWPDVRFMVRTGFSNVLIRELRGGGLDVLVGYSMETPHDARHSWVNEMVWSRGLATAYDTSEPVPLVTYGAPGLFHRIAVEALKEAGLAWEEVFTSPSVVSLSKAVIAGLGVMPFIKGRVADLGMLPWDDGPLPKLAKLHTGIYVREGGDRIAYDQLADAIAEVLSPFPGKTAPAFVRAGAKSRAKSRRSAA
jgi:DNA-binding transcriptional LysR family regulator